MSRLNREAGVNVKIYLAARKLEGVRSIFSFIFSSNNDQRYGGDNHPEPSEEGIDTPVDERIFGFSDIQSARRWWCSLPDLLKWEEEFDMRLVVFKRTSCCDIVETPTQTMFKPENRKNRVMLPASWLHMKRADELERYVDKEFENILPG